MTSSKLFKRTHQEAERLLSAPGSMLEMENRVYGGSVVEMTMTYLLLKLIAGQVQRVYKNLWPTARDFFISVSEQHADKISVVYEHERLTFREVKKQAIQTAGVLFDRYGDRIALCLRNCPEYVVFFWAAHLVGAVPVLVNSWLPKDPLLHSLLLTQPKVIFFDHERAERMQASISKLTGSGVLGLIVVRHQGEDWPGMVKWSTLVETASPREAIPDPGIEPEDNAVVIFTSGSTGLPKGVLMTQRQFITGLGNGVADAVRAALLQGLDLSTAFEPQPGPQPGVLLPTPMFHVTGTSILLLAAMAGIKVVLMSKWNADEAFKIIKRENITSAGGVPSIVFDLMVKSKELKNLDTLWLGGGPTSESMFEQIRKAFPRASMSQSYGQTECNAGATSFSGEDYYNHPGSVGLSLTCRLVDTEATAKTLTRDGWLKTGDIGYVDEEGYVYVKDRIKDMIIRGGENIDSVMVQNAFYYDPRIYEAAAVGVPDARLGEVVAVLVTLKPEYRGQVPEEAMEAELMTLAKKHLPHFAVPVMIKVHDAEFEHTPSNKILKAPLRQIAAKEWERRRIINIASKM
ncbi:hypothetical protein VNI00_010675 [Paramarasmius palmivorus]|uniref:Uncharacterized protein n=1 Tax=Paramarasmius palmivorus TaxID=297713 RepID=A0AAW0CK91_9AGAR